jgi:hypothetical protein
MGMPDVLGTMRGGRAGGGGSGERMPITNCRACHALFEAGEEYGNAPDRLCTDCRRRGVRLDVFGNRVPGTPEPVHVPPGMRKGNDA